VCTSCNTCCHCSSEGAPNISLEGDAGFAGFAHSMEIKTMDLTATSFLTLQEAADYLRHRKHTLDNMRRMGTGPAFQKNSGRIIYHAEELQRWPVASESYPSSKQWGDGGRGLVPRSRSVFLPPIRLQSMPRDFTDFPIE
jgi:Helix-turn-helix domain